MAKIDYYPKSATQKFGYVTQLADNFDKTKPTYVTAYFSGQGEEGDGSLAGLKKMMSYPLWGAGNEKDPTPNTAVNHWNVANIYVQSTKASAYRSGEVDFILDRIKEHFPNIIGKPCAVCLSMGGFIVEVIQTKEQASKWFRFVMLMTGNTNATRNANFVKAVVAAGCELLFTHSLNDTTAPPAISKKMHDDIISQGGKSKYVMYQFGGHGSAGWALTAFAPPLGWLMWNITNQITTPDSFRPDFSMYQFLSSDQGADLTKIFLDWGWTDKGGERWVWTDGTDVDLGIPGETIKGIYKKMDFLDDKSKRGLLRISVAFVNDKVKKGIGPTKANIVIERS